MLGIITLLFVIIGLSLSLPPAPRKSANEREYIATELKIAAGILVGVATFMALANLLT
jgi:hypothetical protein